jgi:hypothetical protein
MRAAEQIDADAADERVFSNSTEYEIWANNGRACYDCTNDDPETEKYCPILSTMLLSKWPKEIEHAPYEWTDNDGTVHTYPVAGECSEFEERRDDDGGDPEPEPPPPDPAEQERVGQLDIFGVFADQITERATELAPRGVHA